MCVGVANLATRAALPLAGGYSRPLGYGIIFIRQDTCVCGFFAVKYRKDDASGKDVFPL